MSEIMKWLSNWWILLVFLIVTIVGFVFLYVGGDTDFVSEVIKALDTSSAIALSLLAFYAYYQYSKEKHDIKKFSDQLKIIETLENKNGFIGIQFGGGNKNALLEMQKFATDLNIDSNFIITKQFGDENNHVSSVDIARLEKYLQKEAMPMLAGADIIHLAVSGAGIAFFVCGDILGNWKPTVVYHRNQHGTYEQWYNDSKHRDKIESTLKDIV